MSENLRNIHSELIAELIADLKNKKPSEVTDSYWLFARREKGEYPRHTQNTGKWLVFVPLLQVDQVWEQIKQALENGRLGRSAKVSTARPNPNAFNPETKVICVYTYDWTDKEDVMNIREELRRLGVTSKIAYKTDEETRSGAYANRGNKQISKYYE
ncbi:putative phosphothreonine lyase domain-containg protein [Acidithiobacillus thiooxidans]|uniref:putative phosphothreonine lyase domain-containing protein n=1 Tax=Acidithiobacillus thiooxidans TaxID=930 RepID=UPI000691F9E8|nr:putative phosphothreonine lyase domain-containg protein [Acidithiobacillus thiooxidans]